MKTFGQLYPAICSWENLELAARRARQGKRYRLYAEEFELRRESILREIRVELLAERWQPRPYETFVIQDPKRRLICAPCYRDRIVHHALSNVVAPLFERSMCAHSYSCRVGKGTTAARARCRWLVANRRFALKLDVRSYFPSIDHLLLKEKIRRHIRCRPTLALMDDIIDSWSDPEIPPRWFEGDDLLAPAGRPRGLPIGALTSQLFANLYLNQLDHFVEEHIQPAGYLRYTDDLLLFAHDKPFLHEAFKLILQKFAAERLAPHPTKCRVHACREGIPFLGFRFFPARVRVLRANRLRFERRMSLLRRQVGDGRPVADIGPRMFAWFQFIREFASNEGLVRAESRWHIF